MEPAPTQAEAGKHALLTVLVHAILVTVTFASLQFLLRSLGRFADNDMDFGRFGDNGVLLLALQVGSFLSRPVSAIPLFAGMLLLDWRLSLALVRRHGRVAVSRSSLAVAAAALALLTVVQLAVGHYFTVLANRYDRVHDEARARPAESRLRQSIPFECNDLTLQEAIDLLNHVNPDIRIVLHASAEQARTLRVTYVPVDDAYVPLRLALEVLRTRVEDLYGLKVWWAAKGDQIDFCLLAGGPQAPVQPAPAPVPAF